MDRLGYSSSEASTRVGRAINRLYREVGTAIGMSFMRQTSISTLVSIGNPTVTFTATEKVLQVWRLSGAKPIILDEVLLAELKESTTPNSDAPTVWALVSASNNTVTIRLNASPLTGYTIYADAIAEVSDLSGSQEPGIPESFHDILIEGVLKDEYKRLEKVKLAQESEATFQRRTSDLRMFVAKSNYLLVQQGKLTASEPSRAGSGGSASFGTTPLIITVAWTFDRDPSAPFIVTDGSDYVTNLYAEGVGNMASQRLIGKDVGTGESEQLTVSGGIEFTGSGGIHTTAFTGDVAKGAGGVILTIQPNTVDFPRMVDIPTNSLIGRDSAGTGDPETILLNVTLEMDTAGNLQRAAISGDVTVPAGSNVATIPSNTVEYAQIQDVTAASRLLGRGSAAGAGDIDEMTVGSGLSISGTVLDVVVPGSDTQIIFKDGSAFGADSGLTYNKTTDALTIAGQLIISGAAAGQVVFPASQNASSNVNTLDDYEEGTWTPTITAGSGSMTYSTQFGSYTKIGRLVTCMFKVVTTGDTLSGNLSISGLPFTSINDTFPGGGLMTSWSSIGTAIIQERIEVTPNTTTALLNLNTAANQSTTTAADTDIDSSSTLTGIFTYHAAN